MAIPNASDTTVVQSTMTGTRGKFSVHEHAHEKIMGVLTNLYEDPENAVVREYLTNALDAQRERQERDPNWKWRPIEVTTPSHFAKTYKIRDYGVGMSVSDIENVYSQYGYSTKEHTNDQTGMLGLGSKCGLTYTGQFIVTGYKDGVRTRALITLNENEVPEYIIQDTMATNEDNGVEISIPVKDRNSFVEKTNSFLKWWDAGLVLVNGQPPAQHGLTEVKPGVFLIDPHYGTYHYNRTQPSSFVIMGGVPYTVDPEYVDEGLRSAYLGFAAYVPMGTVDFPPSRERLRYNSRTKAAVSKVSEGLFEAILDEKLKEITSAPDFQTAYKLKSNLANHFASHKNATDLKYKGHDFPSDRGLMHDHMELDWDWQGHGQTSDRKWVNIGSAMNGALIVTGVVQGTKPTSYFKKKVRHYMETNNLTSEHAILVSDDIDSVWLDWLPRIDADTIKNIKLPKSTSASTGPRADSPYEYYTYDATAKKSTFNSDTTITVPAGKTLVYISPQDMKETYRKNGCKPGDLLARFGEDYILAVMGKNRFDKFIRTHTAITARKAFEQRIDAYVKAATDAEFIVGKLEYGERQFLESVVATSIKDPDLKDLAEMVQKKNYTANYTKAEELHSFARRASVILPALPEKKTVKDNPAKRYPLINHVGGRQVKHLTIYVNALYDMEYAPKKP